MSGMLKESPTCACLAAGMMNVPPATRPKTLEDLVGPWGGYSSNTKKKASKIKSALQVFLCRPKDAAMPPLLAILLRWSLACRAGSRLCTHTAKQ